MRNHRITKPDFRPCSTCRSRSQAPLCLYTLRMISNHSEGTFGRLRYILGGDRPSQTAHLTLSPTDQAGLEFQYSQGSIPPTPPPKLALRLLRLLPILYKLYQNSISGYSKAPRGLSVLSRVTCIFTGTIISPSLSLRQCPDRYAFRAGRNLPDKEFRYLRTVIVTPFTGASIQSFSQRITPPLNLPAPGRRQPLYFALRLRRDLCFC